MNNLVVPSGKIVWEHKEFGNHFLVELLDVPVERGAGLRTHRLWHNGGPCTGGQYHYDLDGAIQWATYRLKGDYVERIRWLEHKVHKLEAELHLRHPIDVLVTEETILNLVRDYGDHRVDMVGLEGKAYVERREQAGKFLQKIRKYIRLHRELPAEPENGAQSKSGLVEQFAIGLKSILGLPKQEQT